MCLAGTRHVETVQNAVGARQGDMVSVCNGDPPLWRDAAALYVIPALWLIIGAIIGAGLGIDWQIGEAGGAVLIGLSGFGIGFMIVFIVSKSLKVGQEIAPRIVCVIESHPVERAPKLALRKHTAAAGRFHTL
jgi:positive regulator of sigma E activity